MPIKIPINSISDYSLKSIFTDTEPLLPYVSVLRYSKGETIICNFFSEKKFYISVNGRFNMYYFQSNGEQLFIRSCDGVIVAGEMEFVRHIWPDLGVPDNKEFYFEMTTECTMIILDYNAVQDILAKDSRFLSFICHSLVEKLNYFGTMEINSNVYSATSAVANFLLSSADPSGVWKGNQKLVAEHLRLSYRHMHRVLKDFVDDGCIERSPKGYKIIDRKKLEQYLD